MRLVKDGFPYRNYRQFEVSSAVSPSYYPAEFSASELAMMLHIACQWRFRVVANYEVTFTVYYSDGITSEGPYDMQALGSFSDFLEADNRSTDPESVLLSSETFSYTGSKLVGTQINNNITLGTSFNSDITLFGSFSFMTPELLTGYPDPLPTADANIYLLRRILNGKYIPPFRANFTIGGGAIGPNLTGSTILQRVGDDSPNLNIGVATIPVSVPMYVYKSQDQVIPDPFPPSGGGEWFWDVNYAAATLTLTLEPSLFRGFDPGVGGNIWNTITGAKMRPNYDYS